MAIRIGKKSVSLVSKKSGRNLGAFGFSTPKSKKQAISKAKKRERQVQFFKRKK